MEIKMKFFWNRKGIIFTIDSVIAITLVVIILITATNYVARSQEDVLPELQLVRAGNDILTLLDNTNSFEGTDMGELLNNLDRLVPATYEMKIRLTLKDENPEETVSQDVPIDRFIGTGERVFVIKDGEELKFGIARFFIWSKD